MENLGEMIEKALVKEEQGRKEKKIIQKNPRKEFARKAFESLRVAGLSEAGARKTMRAAGPGNVKLVIAWGWYLKNSGWTRDMVVSLLGGLLEAPFGKDRRVEVLFSIIDMKDDREITGRIYDEWNPSIQGLSSRRFDRFLWGLIEVFESLDRDARRISREAEKGGYWESDESKKMKAEKPKPFSSEIVGRPGSIEWEMTAG